METTEQIIELIKSGDPATLCELAERIDDLPKLYWLGLCICINSSSCIQEENAQLREVLAILHSRFSKRDAARDPKHLSPCVMRNINLRGNLFRSYGEPASPELSEQAFWELIESEISRFDSAELRAALPDWERQMVAGEISLSCAQSIIAIRNICIQTREFVRDLQTLPPSVEWWLSNEHLNLPPIDENIYDD